MTIVAESDGGNCFQVAAGFLSSGIIEQWAAANSRPVVYGDKSIWRIVHGLPVGTGGRVAGVRYWHAWVEVETMLGVCVVDVSNDKDVRIARETFYRVGQLDEQHVWRFTPAEAERLRRRLGHCGPWVDGWESVGDGVARHRHDGRLYAVLNLGRGPECAFVHCEHPRSFDDDVTATR